MAKAKASAKKTVTLHRRADNGQFCSKKFVKAFPKITITEIRKLG